MAAYPYFDPDSPFTTPSPLPSPTPTPTPIPTHPFIRAYANIMGQAHPRGMGMAGGVQLECAASTGPDPTIFRQHPRYPNGQIAQQPSPSTPPSAAIPVVGAQAMESKSSSKGRGLARKLSRRRSPPAALAKKSMGPDPFEARPFSPLQAAFDHDELQKQAQQQQQKEATATVKVKAGAFARPAAQTTARVVFPFPSPAPAAPVRHLNSAVSSSRSHKLSIKSSPSRRAEREWRAKVAAMGHLNRSPQAGTSRGPVPPRRIMPDRSERRSSSPEEEQQVVTPTTPHHLVVAEGEDKGTPAKSFASNRSFETLGHYANANPSTAPVPGTMLVASPGHRQCSVPRSVVSSFYFDDRTSRVSTALPHPSSPVKPVAELRVAADPQSQPQHQASLPPFASFQRSPASVGAPLGASPVPAPINPRASGSESKLATPIKLSTSNGSSSSSSIPPPQTPQRAHSGMDSQSSVGPGDGVHTPYSPTTAYILHADLDHVDQHLFAGDLALDLSMSPPAQHKRQRHPYAGADPHSPPHARRQGLPIPLYAQPRREINSQPCRHHHGQGQGQGVKAHILGDRSYGARAGSTVLSRKRIDLTPGMETGYRPPKSGLPVADLERWLASTTIAE